MWISRSLKRAGLLTTELLLSTISVSRVMGAGGENCQCKSASPAAVAHRATWAMRKSPLQPPGQLLRAPEAKAMEPGPTDTPLNTHAEGPLHISFWRVASNVV